MGSIAVPFADPGGKRRITLHKGKTMSRDVVIVDSVRTGLAKSFRGSFNLTRSDDMLAHCIDAILEL